MSTCSTIERRWERLFAGAWQTIVKSENLERLAPKVKVRFSPRMDARLCARIEWNRSVQIVISTKFAEELHRELTELGPTLSGLAFASSKTRKRHGLEVISAVEDLAISFVLLHELFHLLGGHFDWLRLERGIGHFDEQRIGLAFARQGSTRSLGRPSRAALTTSYVLESEADCNAVQWLIQYASLDRLQGLLRLKSPVIGDLPPKERLTAFRLALAAIWLVIRKLEFSRVTWLEHDGKTHPLPVTRLFMAFGTLLREYSEISDIQYDAEGGGQHRLSARDIASIREFLLHVLGPVLKADWSPGSETVSSNSLEGQMRLYFPDFANHMLNREVTTKVGRQMIQMERARFRMDRTLRPFRFFPTAELQRRS